MKSIKLLIISFTLTFLMLMTVSPALAKPLANVQHLQVNNMLPTAHSSYDPMTVADKTFSKFSMPYGNNFSTGLILSKAGILTEENAQVTMTVVNKSNDFFASAMIVSDKLNQLISYFNSSPKDRIAEQIEPEVENKLIKKKCSSKVNFS